MDCCRNFKTHPHEMNFNIGGETCRMFVEPTCKYCKECGYERYDADHPMWDGGENYEELIKEHRNES